MSRTQWIGRCLATYALLAAALAGRAEAQSASVCTNGGCIKLANHIAASKLPANTDALLVGAVSAAGAKILAFCDEWNHKLTIPTNSSGQWIQLLSNNSLDADLSICFGGRNMEMQFTRIAWNCNDPNATPLIPISLNGHSVAVSAGAGSTYFTELDFYSFDFTGLVQMCGNDARNNFDAFDSGFSVGDGYGREDTMTTSYREGGDLRGGSANDVLDGATPLSGWSSCFGNSGTDTCACDSESSCERNF